MKTTFDPRYRRSGVAVPVCRAGEMATFRSLTLLACLTMAVLALTFLTPTAAAVDLVLHSFAAPPDGNNPYAALVSDKFGNLCGTTMSGGTKNLGTVFVECAPLASGSPDIEPCVAGARAWESHVLYNFEGLAADDGSMPTSTLIFGGDYAGRAFTLYATTYFGGVGGNCGGGEGCGTVFELCAPAAAGGCGGADWKENVLYRFVGGSFDGANPTAGVI